MKSTSLFLFILFVSAWANASFAAFVQSVLLAKNGKAYISIYIATDNPPEVFAASELTHYLHEITGASFAIKIGRTEAKPQIILKENKRLDAEDYSISLENRNIILQGGSPRAILFAVYRFLHQLGCCWIAPKYSYYKGHSEWVPKIPVLIYNSATDIKEHPAFAIRKIDIEEGRTHTIENLKQLIEWMPKVGLNTFMVPMDYQGTGKVQWDKWRNELVPELKKRDLLIEVGGHGYQNFLNAHMEQGTLFTKHQEWFGRNKKDQPDAATNLVFNTSNQEAVEYFINNILHYLEQHPEIDIFDLWPPDVARWAETTAFASLGTPADRQAALVNRVDSVIVRLRPGLRLEIIAYGQVLEPPRNVSLNRDILVDICPIDQSFEKPVFDASNSNNKEYQTAIFNWRKSFAGYLGLYSYYRKYAWRSLPVIIPHFMQQELQWYSKLNFKSISWYSEPADWYTYELNHYTLAALAWDTSTSVDSVMKKYCVLRYGSFASLTYAVYKELETMVPLYCSIPFTSHKSREEYNNAYSKLMTAEKSLSAVLTTAKEPQKENLKRLSLMVQYAASDIALLSNSLYDKKDPQPQVEQLYHFLQENSAMGVFLPGYSITTILKPYNSK